jgi:hypothetical protein
VLTPRVVRASIPPCPARPGQSPTSDDAGPDGDEVGGTGRARFAWWSARNDLGQHEGPQRGAMRSAPSIRTVVPLR